MGGDSSGHPGLEWCPHSHPSGPLRCAPPSLCWEHPDTPGGWGRAQRTSSMVTFQMCVKLSSRPYFSFRRGVTTAVSSVSAWKKRQRNTIRKGPGEHHRAKSPHTGLSPWGGDQPAPAWPGVRHTASLWPEDSLAPSTLTSALRHRGHL